MKIRGIAVGMLSATVFVAATAVFATAGVANTAPPAPAARAAMKVVDARGVVLVLARPAVRIITLAPSLAEIAFAAGAGARVVGVSSYSETPAEAARLPVVASHGRVNIERVLALQPDLVLAWKSGNPARDLARLERLGLPVFAAEPLTLDDIAQLLRTVGHFADTAPAAEAAATAFETGAAALAPEGLQRPLDVFFEIWHDPLITINDRHLISEIMRICGGRNVFVNLPVAAPRIAREVLLALDPEVIITSVAFGQDSWRDLPMLRAVRRGRIYPVDPREIHAQGPRVLEGARAVCAALSAARAEIRSR